MAGAAPTRLRLRHPGGETPVVVGRGALAAAAAELGDRLRGRALFAVTTPRVRRLHPGPLELLETAGGRLTVLEVEEGEGAKTPATAASLWSRMLAGGGRRDSRVVAFGGGSVGDLAGFVAGAFLRGVPVVQLPTTLLAQVDAAIGGKTAVDLPEAKNSVGLFHHPELVVCDTELLATLPREELRSGLYEVIKIALLRSPDLLERVEDDAEALLAGDVERLAPVVAGAAAAKIEVVAGDPDDRGRRRILNFGHTLGHAIEAALGYDGLRHGEAVGYGMLFALRLARRRGLDPAVELRLGALVERLGLPPLPALDPERLMAFVARDKKAGEEGVVWVLPTAVGAGANATPVGPAEVRRELESFLEAPFGGR